jgi:hypothetical protein
VQDLGKSGVVQFVSERHLLNRYSMSGGLKRYRFSAAWVLAAHRLVGSCS